MQEQLESKKSKVNPRVACLSRNLIRIDLCKTNLSRSCHAQYRRGSKTLIVIPNVEQKFPKVNKHAQSQYGHEESNKSVEDRDGTFTG